MSSRALIIGNSDGERRCQAVHDGRRSGCTAFTDMHPEEARSIHRSSDRDPAGKLSSLDVAVE